jgi:hypothetical protein
MLVGGMGDGVAHTILDVPGVMVPVLTVRYVGPFSGYARRKYTLDMVEGDANPVKLTLTIV